MSETLYIGIAGLGTVGGGVVKILQQHKDVIAARCGREMEILAVSARDKNRDRGVDLSAYEWMDDPLALAADARIDVVVEMIGGSEGLAKTLVENALKAGKSVVTANKALLAHQGYALAQLAEEHNVSLMYEAAVAGGIPVIKALREGLAANEIEALHGILNGTCNYILTAMRETGGDFGPILTEAQEKGYAEADPTFDVEGIDAAHKTCLLSALAFGVKPDFEALGVTGISRVTATDIAAAGELGYRIKLLGVTRRLEGGAIYQCVEPCLVPVNSPIGGVEDVFNAIEMTGDFVDRGLLVGRGAGEGPTASSVVADLIDIARGINVPVFGVPVEALKDARWAGDEDVSARFYMRLQVEDHPGVMADIAALLRDHEVSMESVVQHGGVGAGRASMVITTHAARQAKVKALVASLAGLSVVVDEPTIMRIETL